MNKATLLAGLLMAVLIWIGYQQWETAQTGPALRSFTPLAPEAAQTTQWPATAASTPVPPRGDSPLLPTESYRDASQSIQDSYVHGDKRMPPIERSSETEAPTEAELNNPEQYKQYETRQTRRVYQAYLKATDAELPRLQQQLEQGKQSGIAADELAKMEEKIRRIRDMRGQVQQTLAQP